MEYYAKDTMLSNYYGFKKACYAALPLTPGLRCIKTALVQKLVPVWLLALGATTNSKNDFWMMWPH